MRYTWVGPKHFHTGETYYRLLRFQRVAGAPFVVSLESWRYDGPSPCGSSGCPGHVFVQDENQAGREGDRLNAKRLMFRNDEEACNSFYSWVDLQNALPFIPSAITQFPLHIHWDRPGVQWYVSSFSDICRNERRSEVVALRLYGIPKHHEIRSLDEYEHLRVMDLSQLSITDEDLRLVVKASPNLRSLWLNGTRVSQKGLTVIEECQCLEELAIQGCKLGDGTFAFLKGLPVLSRLGASRSRLSTRAVRTITGCKSLSSIELECSEIRDRDVALITQSLSLKAARFFGTLIGDAAANALSRQPDLHTLGIGGTNVSSSGVKMLSRCETIVQLGLSFAHIDRNAIKYLRAYKKLECVSLRSAAVELRTILNLSKLRPDVRIEMEQLW